MTINSNQKDTQQVKPYRPHENMVQIAAVMTRDEVIRLAREVGDKTTDSRGRVNYEFDEYGLVRFAAMVAATARARVIKAVSAAICARGEV
jgi:hypothetical protein